MSDVTRTGFIGATPTTGAPIEEPEFAPGAQIGEYQVTGSIASGGFGTVYGAQHRVLGRRAAIKVLHANLSTSAEMVSRFLLEARVVNQIRHPNIVDIFDFGQLPDGRPYCVMELLEGQTLHDLVRSKGRLTPSQALAYLEPVCDALSAAHAVGVVHRDLKASNAFVVEEGDRPQVKLLDFGIAKLLHPEPGEAGLTAMGQRLGSGCAMAPEQIRGDPIDTRVDVYALGVMLYRITVGQYPFHSMNEAELLRLHLEAPPPRASQAAPVPRAIDDVVIKALAKNAKDRFQSVAEFVSALRAAVGTASSGSSASAGVAQVLGIYLEATMGEGVSEDEGLDHIIELLDGAERGAMALGFSVQFATSNALLAVKALPADAGAAEALRRQGVELATRLQQQVRSAPVAGLTWRMVVHADLGETRVTAAGTEVVGGPITQVGRWPAPSPGNISTSVVLQAQSPSA